MIVVYCFYPGDQDLALKNARWMNELGGCKGHEALVCYDIRCDPGITEAIGQEMLKAFDKVYRLPAQATIDGWPEGANYFFRIINSWMVGTTRPYYLWLEPDAIALRAGWLDILESEYKNAGKPFMGDRVQVEDIPLHMSGVGIYPNPLHQYAGEAYRAAEVAWDMAGKDQIISQAHFTKLIEHAWKHPSFRDQFEINTQIARETILFHSSKDGSLIDIQMSKLPIPNQSVATGRNLLRKVLTSQAASHTVDPMTAVPVLAESTPNTDESCLVGQGEARESTSVKRPDALGSSDLPLIQDSRGGSQDFICDIFIRTYPGDYEWLEFCLASIDQFVTGFRKIWVISPSNPPDWFRQLKSDRTAIPVEWKVMNDETEDGYLAQQITKLYADVITDYQADYILYVDSDVIFTRSTTPEYFFTGDLMTWYYTPHELISTPWQPIMEKFMGFHQPYEFMRRLPMMVPRWIYPRLREFCHNQHDLIISDYIRMQPQRAFSEFNALGAYAFFHCKDRFDWIDTSTVPVMPEPCARQFHSWSGLTPEVKSEIDNILQGGAEEARLAHNQEAVGSIPTPAIKELPSGVWVLEGDQISDWIIQEGRLDHDQNFLPDILKHINPGDTVVDAGAFIGDHAVAYSDAVGKHGLVLAYEPNPVAFKCLQHNMRDRYNVVFLEFALGDAPGIMSLSGNNGNYGGCYAGDHMKVADVAVRTLDDQLGNTPVQFIKIDVEGCEVKVLQGAERMINRCQPRMVIEVNQVALDRQHQKPADIFAWLKDHGYTYKIIQENCSWEDPLYDILCLPTKHQPPEIISEIAFRTPVAVISSVKEMYECVDQLKKFCDASIDNKRMLMQRLVFSGLKKPDPKNQKRNRVAKK